MGTNADENDDHAATLALKLLRLEYLLVAARTALAGGQASERDVGRALRYLGEAWQCANGAFEEVVAQAHLTGLSKASGRNLEPPTEG